MYLIFIHFSHRFELFFEFAIVRKLYLKNVFVFCVKMYTLSIKIRKGHEEGIAYLCNVGKWIP